MTRRPGERDPDPPGGRAAQRLREFIEQRFPGRKGPSEPDTETHEHRPTGEEPGESDVAPEDGEGEEHGSGPGREGSAS